MAPVVGIILLKKIHTSIKLLSIIVTFSVFIFNFRRAQNSPAKKGKQWKWSCRKEYCISATNQHVSHSVSFCAIRVTSLLLLLLLRCLPPPFNSLMSLKIKFNFRKKNRTLKNKQHVVVRGEKNISSFF